MRGFFAFSCVLLVAPTAFGDGGQVQAEALFTQSESLYQQGDFRGAITLLEEAHRLSPNAILLYNLARAHESLGQSAQAATYYRKYLEMDPGAADRGAVEKRIATLTRVEPPTKTESGAARSPAATSPQVVGSSPSAVPWVFAGIGGVTLGTGFVMGGLALATHAEAKAPTTDGVETERLQSRASSFATAANILIVAGGTVSLAGLVWGAVDVASSDAGVSAWVGPTGVSLTGSF